LQYLGNTTVPIILHACHESRTEALKVYKLSFGPKAYSPRRQNQGKIYFNFKRDIFYLRSNPNMTAHTIMDKISVFLTFQSMVDKTENLDHVQSMIMRGDLAWAFAEFIQHFRKGNVFGKLTGLVEIMELSALMTQRSHRWICN